MWAALEAVFPSALFAKQWPQTICIRITWNSYFKMNWDPPVSLHPWVRWAIQILLFQSTSPDFIGHLSCSHSSTKSSLLICSRQHGPQLPVLFVPLCWWVKPAVWDILCCSLADLRHSTLFYFFGGGATLTLYLWDQHLNSAFHWENWLLRILRERDKTWIAFFWVAFLLVQMWRLSFTVMKQSSKVAGIILLKLSRLIM